MTSIENIKMYLKNPVRLLVRLGRNSFLKIVPDKLYTTMIFKERLGYAPDFENPKTFNEKISYLKIIDHKPEYIEMVDKFAAKEYASAIIGPEHIIPTLGVWKAFEEINFDDLPSQFVLKCTHDSGGLVICRNKNKLDIEQARRKINRSLNTNYYWSNREWPYKEVEPRIIAEPYLENIDGEGLIDYKFFCFRGVPKLLYISKGLENHKTARISFYDLKGQEMPFHRSDYRSLGVVKLPDNFEQMCSLAEKLAKSIPSIFVRIDLYSMQKNIYFSEITFSPCSGMIPFEPREWDSKLGEWIQM